MRSIASSSDGSRADTNHFPLFAFGANSVSGDVAVTGAIRKATVDIVSGATLVDAAGDVNTRNHHGLIRGRGRTLSGRRMNRRLPDT